MTAEEAKKYLEDKVSNADLTSSYVGVNWRDVYKTAIEALEKQIPKKPNITIHNGYCGNCGCAWGYDRLSTEERCGYTYFQYCPACGQRIDWSEEEG